MKIDWHITSPTLRINRIDPISLTHLTILRLSESALPSYEGTVEAYRERYLMSQEAKVDISALQNVTATRAHIEQVCLNTYSLNTVKKSCYRFSSRYFSELNSNESEAFVTFKFPSTVSAAEEQEIITRFHQDLVDQSLREIVAAETETARNLILANAFANTDLADDSDE